MESAKVATPHRLRRSSPPGEPIIYFILNNVFRFTQYYTPPTASAKNQPMGTLHQMPVTPIAGMADSA